VRRGDEAGGDQQGVAGQEGEEQPRLDEDDRRDADVAGRGHQRLEVAELIEEIEEEVHIGPKAKPDARRTTNR
jgi:hypothetical protein